jgi:Ser/Thr protein kinase RdoA (MazF antagonist)
MILVTCNSDVHPAKGIGRTIVTRMRDACLVDGDGAPRNRFSRFSPVFPVRDLRRALAHYASLGFQVEPYADGDGYGFAGRDEVSLHLSLDEGHGPGAGHQHVGTAYLYVEDADALYEEWARPAVGGLTRRVGDTPYQLREGSHVDPDGNLIRFGSPMPARPAERLRAHLQTRYGITADVMTELDLGVWRVGRAEGPDWVARWFPARRPAEAVAGDAAILRYLAAHEFPAERCAADEPVSVLDGRSVLVTEWADPVPRQDRRDAIRAAGGLSQLGSLLGRLYTLGPTPAANAGSTSAGGTSAGGTSAGDGAIARPGGAWHHLADGLPSAEIAAAGRMLAEAAPVIPDAERAAFDALRAEVAALDAGEGLPEGLIHPDFVLANVVASPGDMVVVDWAGAGRGPRLWSLAFLLYAEAAKEPRRAGAVLLGYREHVTLEADELDRLGAVAQARPLVLRAWSVCMGHTSPTEAMTAAAQTKALTEMIATRIRAAVAGH